MDVAALAEAAPVVGCFSTRASRAARRAGGRSIVVLHPRGSGTGGGRGAVAYLYTSGLHTHLAIVHAPGTLVAASDSSARRHPRHGGDRALGSRSRRDYAVSSPNVVTSPVTGAKRPTAFRHAVGCDLGRDVPSHAHLPGHPLLAALSPLASAAFGSTLSLSCAPLAPSSSCLLCYGFSSSFLPAPVLPSLALLFVIRARRAADRAREERHLGDEGEGCFVRCVRSSAQRAYTVL